MLIFSGFIVSIIIVLVESAPGGFITGGGAIESGGDIPSLFTFENGNVGVNFLGFKASAGLGGLLSGRSGIGGLHAEAGTPFGQSARAGLGGTLNGEGKSVGGIYADASAGGDVAAGAGLAGSVGQEGSFGTSYAGSSAGGVYKTKTKTKTVATVKSEVSPVKVVEKHAESTPQKTYIERTVIPNYEEKTIFVPSYVEKTIKVPTVVEKKVKVPVAPTIIEKEVHAPAEVNYQQSDLQVVEQAPVASTFIHKHKVHSRPFFRKHFFVGSGFGGGYAGEGAGGYSGGGITGTKTFTYQKTANANLAENVLNIPISTLGAVSKLLSGISGGATGSLSVSKSVAVS